jgi:hypothetical protein
MRKAVTTLLTILLLAACKQDYAPDAESKIAAPAVRSETDSAAHPGSPGGTAIVPDVSAGTTVLVVVNDGSIAAKGQAVPPGPAVITVQNGGTEVHNLFIEGEGISRAAGDNLEAGGTATTDVVLEPGTYLLYCPILDHRDKGESAQITVSAS